MSADIVQIRDYQPKRCDGSWNSEPCRVVVLPVVRIERNPGRPERLPKRLKQRKLSLKARMTELRARQLAAAERGD